MLQLLKNSILTAKGQWRHILIVYGFQFLLAITLGAQAFHVLESSIGNSMEISKLLEGYDHTVISDFLNVHGASITPLLGQLRWLLLVYLVFSVFLNAGLFSGVVHGDKKWMSFWQGGAAYFFPFLKIGLIFTGIIAFLGATMFGTFAANWQRTIEIFPSEKYTVWLLYVLIGLFLLIAGFMYLWSIFARLHYVQGIKKMRNAIRKGWKTAWSNFRSNFWILIIYGLVMLAITAIYWLMEQRWGMTTAGLIVFFFFLQQIFVLFRIGWRVTLYDGLVSKWKQKNA